MWQDFALLIVIWVYVVCMLPTVFDKKAEVPRTTSTTYACAVTMLGVAYYTLELYIATTAFIVLLFIWIFIFLFRPLREQASSKEEN